MRWYHALEEIEADMNVNELRCWNEWLDLIGNL